MAIKFSELPRTASFNSNASTDANKPYYLFPVVSVGTSSNLLSVISGATMSTFVGGIVDTSLISITANLGTLTSNAAAQQTTINTLTSGQSTHTGQITTIQGQITSLQSNTGSLADQITAVQAATLSGVVNNVLVTGPLVKSGNATYPNISIPVATTSTNGYLSSTDWTTFDNKAPTANPTFTGTVTTANLIPSANAVSNIGSESYQYNTIFARATSAQYADLAEKYLPDAEYPVGTVVMIGGDAEVTACEPGRRAIGAISANPAYEMNSGLEGGVFVALKGRVPVFVAGPVVKGHDLVADTRGTAVMNSDYVGGIPFAIALETNDDPGIKLVEALVL